MNKINYDSNDSSKVFLWSVLLPQVVGFFLVLILSFFMEQADIEGSLTTLVLSALLGQFCFAFIFFFYNKKNCINYKQATSFSFNVAGRNILVCVVISFVAIFGFNNLIGIISQFFSSLGFGLGASLPLSSVGWLVLNIVILGIMPAIFEELIFRGIIFNGFKSRGFMFGAIMSSVMFALIHGSVHQLVFPLIMGFIFCVILKKTGNILYTILTHFCNNLIVILVQYFNGLTSKTFGTINCVSVWDYVLVFALAIFACVVIFVLLKFGLKKQEKINNTECNIENDLTNINKKSNNKFVIITIIVGVVYWLMCIFTTFA